MIVFKEQGRRYADLQRENQRIQQNQEDEDRKAARESEEERTRIEALKAFLDMDPNHPGVIASSKSRTANSRRCRQTE